MLHQRVACRNQPRCLWTLKQLVSLTLWPLYDVVEGCMCGTIPESRVTV